jgi:ribonuclease HII
LAGADEAGRGCLAGPLVAAAVVLDYNRFPFKALKGLTDSKMMTREARERMYTQVLRSATRISVSVASPQNIDRIGLHVCNLELLRRCLDTLSLRYELAIVDAFDLRRPELRSHGIVGADYKSAAVAAASVVAKVVRDRLMRRMASSYPEYGFEEHVGYATEAHKRALRMHGPSRIHRFSFQGVANPRLDNWEEAAEPAPGETGGQER